MASVTVNRTDLFPNTTVIYAFPRSLFHTGSVPTLPPTATATASATMTSGTATLEGLTAGAEYTVMAEVNNVLQFLAVQAPASTAVEAQTGNAQPAMQKLLAWTFDPIYASGTFGGASFTAGTLYKHRIPVVGEPKVGHILLDLTTKAATLTASENFMGLFAEGTRKLLAKVTAAELITAAEGGTGLIELALESAVVLGPGYVDLAHFYKGTTKPTYASAPLATAGVINAGSTGAGLRNSSADTGLTTALPATMSSTQTALAGPVWAALAA